MSSDELPLPYGWVKEVDPRTDHPFYVDTKADPPRAIWVHPYNDEQYLNEHPDVKEKVGNMKQQMLEAHDSKASLRERRHSIGGHESADREEGPSTAGPSKGKGKRNFFGKIKDKAIGTKEEREAHKKEMQRIQAERYKQRQELLRAQQERFAKRQAEYEEAQRQRAAQFPPQQYGPPSGNPYAMYGDRGYGDPYAYGSPGYGYNNNAYVDPYYGNNGYGRGGRGGGFGGGGGGSALPLIGALAGGLLLGDILF
ncbi:hypothetical protein BV25DRAFT_1911313 [Artomyces pyxidatus]|uniref:Uncharacterized protein n=1 Tax=Artomyces pyxidatus TaxID=48021 RepID=A0ACB8TIR0_9AGAM|nr:hypothetical protein BV25DRAFT_1911313 [Artomyces pyxidatus]